MARLEPIGIEVKEAIFGPVAGGGEEDQEQDGAVEAGPRGEVCKYKEGDHEPYGNQSVDPQDWVDFKY